MSLVFDVMAMLCYSVVILYGVSVIGIFTKISAFS